MTNIKDALASGSHKLGCLTWYDSRDVNVTPTRLKMLFDKHGLDTRHFPQDIKPKNAFQKSVRKAIADVSKSNDDRRCIAKLIVDGESKLVYGVVDLNVHELSESIDPDFSDKVWLDKNSFSVSYEHGHELSKKVKNLFDQLCGEYTTRDVSRMIVKTMDRLCSVPLRDAGVIYFVPVEFDKELRALQNVVNDLGNCNMRVYTIGTHDGNVEGIEKAAKSQIQDKISKLKDEIEDLKISISDGTVKGKTIENSVEVRRRKFNELKMRCLILSDTLRIKADSLEGDLGEIDKMIAQELETLIAGPDKKAV